jgi:cystathionine beta-lyase/cystathionine gamma-synthase
MNLGKAKEHLQTYLKRDKNGLRKALLSILLDGKPHTIPKIYKKLNAVGFSISLRVTSTLVVNPCS